MIVSITKLLILGSTTWNDIKDLSFDYSSSIIKIFLVLLLFDALLGLSCSLWILI